MSKRVNQAVDDKKLVTWFKKAERVYIQKHEGWYYLSDAYVAFRIKNVPAGLEFLQFIEADKSFKWEGGVLEETSLDMLKMWNGVVESLEAEIILSGNVHTLSTTIRLIEPSEGVYIRVLENDTVKTFVDKKYMDMLNTCLGTLEHEYQFLTGSKSKPVVVKYHVPRGYEQPECWEPVAILMPFHSNSAEVCKW